MTAATGLNIFQRLVRTWEAVQPYNAAQVLTVDSAIGPQTAQLAWESALASLGLGRVRIDGRYLSHEVLNGDSSRYPVRVLASRTNLATYLSDELNRPYDDPEEPPYRPFLINGDEISRLGVVYRHWVADSISIRRVMQSWCEGIFSLPTTDPRALPAAPGYWDLFGPRNGQLRIDQTALDLFRSHMRFRRVQKVQSVDTSDHSVRVALTDFPDCVDRLRAHASSHSVTVGEILLAALCEAAVEFVPLQSRPRRKDIAVGNIVDLRPHSGRDL